MTTIAIRLPDDQAERLEVLARRHNVSVEDLASAHILELLKKPDEQFEQAARYVLQKNAELYRRLA
jgi:predicted transcriptional regulator